MKRHHLIASDSVQIPHIYSIGFSDDPQTTRFGPSVRSQFIIHYVLYGKGSFNGNTVVGGQGFLIVPGMHEEYRPDESDPWSFLWVISEDPGMEYFFSQHLASEKTNIFHYHNIYELAVTAQQLASATSSASSATHLSEMFLHIYNSCVVSTVASQRSSKRIYYDFAVNYIKTNLHLPIFVSDLCDAIGITQPYLYKIFKQEIGISPKQYISNCKIAEAKKLLSHTELPISLIANSVGYENVLDFSKFFSKQMNISPTTYRNQST